MTTICQQDRSKAISGGIDIRCVLSAGMVHNTVTKDTNDPTDDKQPLYTKR